MQNPILGPLSTTPAELLIRPLDQFRSRVQAADAAPPPSKRQELRKVTQEFESLFVGYLLKVMRESIEESGLMEGGLGKSIYTELFDQEMSKIIASQGTLGIADMLMKRLTVEETAHADAGAGKVAPPPAALPKEKKPELDPDIQDVHLPVHAPISSRFGVRRDPFSQLPRFHRGMDLAAPEGTDVRAALGGEVIFAGSKPGYGNTVILKHDGGLETTYAHLGSTNVRNGEIISSEQVIGIVGNTGHSTGPHLHFEVARWGERVDPQLALTE